MRLLSRLNRLGPRYVSGDKPIQAVAKVLKTFLLPAFDALQQHDAGDRKDGQPKKEAESQ